MSASDKKRLRKEQKEAALTEKQCQAKKEAKSLKIYTAVFVVVMVLIEAIIAGVTLKTPIESQINQNTKAVQIGERKLTSAMMNYYYMDSIRDFYSQFSGFGDYQDMYLSMYTGLSPMTALDQQVYDKTTGATWADHFIESAVSSAKWSYAMYDKAMAENFQLDEETQKYVDNIEDTIDSYATAFGFSSAKSYLRNMYGSGATVKSYAEYCRISAYANAYAQAYYDSLEYTDQDYRDYENEEDRAKTYNSYSYATYTLTISAYHTFMEHGTLTKDDDGKETTTYSDEEIKAAQDAILADLEILTADGIDTVDELNKAILSLDINAEKEDPTKATEYEDQLYSDMTRTDFQEWLSEDDRKAGDIKTIMVATGSETDDEDNFSAYYVLMYLGTNDNTVKMGNVRHILIEFEGGTYDSATQTTFYSDAEKKAAKERAENLLETWKNGEATEESFAKLADLNSADAENSEGGLYQDINPSSTFVDSFHNLALDDHEGGDTGIIESTYGYHIMYYVGDSDLNYRDYMIHADLLADDYADWSDSITNTITSSILSEKGFDKDFVISG